MIKNKFLNILFLGLFLLPIFVFGQFSSPETTAPPDIPTNFFGCNPNRGLRVCLLNILADILRVILVIAIVSAAIFIAWGGVLYTTSPAKKDEAKNRLIAGAAGLVIAFLAWVIVYTLSKVVGTSNI